LAHSIDKYLGDDLLIDVFIQNEAMSTHKRVYNEKTLEYLGSQLVSRPYPYPYGFILNTSSDDNDNLDCFVITRKPLQQGSIVSCQPLALLEQFEDGEIDHNVLASVDGDGERVTDEVVETLRDFILNVFDHVPGKQISVGRTLNRAAAMAHIARCASMK
jgi:inorganic pyrophosphatase